MAELKRVKLVATHQDPQSCHTVFVFSNGEKLTLSDRDLVANPPNFLQHVLLDHGLILDEDADG